MAGTGEDAVNNDSVNAANGQRTALYQSWTITVRAYVGTDLFRYVQFVNRDRDVEYGSSIQKIVCKQCNILPANQQEYWVGHGMDVVLEVLRRKRQAVTTSFRTRFASKYNR